MLLGRWTGETMTDKESKDLIVTEGDIIEVHAKKEAPHEYSDYICRGTRCSVYFMADEWDFEFGFTSL